MGCPIRTPRDQRPLAASPGFSQRATSFIASWRQGIHPMPFSCSSRTHAPAALCKHAGARALKPRHAQKPSTAQNHARQPTAPVPRQSPHSAHTQNALNAMAKPSLEARAARAAPNPRSDTQAKPATDPPADPAKPLARPSKTHRSVLRVQNAPEPDSQSAKNTTHQAPSAKPRPTAVIQRLKPKPDLSPVSP